MKFIYVPHVENLILGKVTKSIKEEFVDENGKKNEVTFIPVQEFTFKLLNSECNAVELLFSVEANKIVHQSSVMLASYEKLKSLLSPELSSFKGMANAELTRYIHKKQRNTGKDLAHGLRSIFQALELQKTGKINYDGSQEYWKLVKNVKYGIVPAETAIPMLESKILELQYESGDGTLDHRNKIREEIILQIYQNL